MVTETETCIEMATPEKEGRNDENMSDVGGVNGSDTSNNLLHTNHHQNHNNHSQENSNSDGNLKASPQDIKRQSATDVEEVIPVEDVEDGEDEEGEEDPSEDASPLPPPPPHIDVPLINKSDPVLIDFSINGKPSSNGINGPSGVGGEQVVDEVVVIPLDTDNKKEEKQRKEDEKVNPGVETGTIPKADDGTKEVEEGSKINGSKKEELKVTESSDAPITNTTATTTTTATNATTTTTTTAAEEESKVKEESGKEKSDDGGQPLAKSLETNGLHQEEGTHSESIPADNKESSNATSNKETKKTFWAKVWPSKESQSNKSEETDIEIIESPTSPTEGSKKNGSSGGTSETATTDVTIPISGGDGGDQKSKSKEFDEKELTPTHVLFRVKSNHFKYIYSFSIFAILLLLCALAALFLFPETFDIHYINLLGEEGKSKLDSDPIVSTNCGQIRGVLEENVAVFRGIPYALPPVGENRWLPAKAPTCDANATIDALDLKDFCYQRPVDGFNLSFSEDCLYLNIWAPKWRKENLIGDDGEGDGEVVEKKPSLPVLVYIAGDSMVGFTSTDIQWLPTGSEVTKRYDSLFVTLNYRLGSFGFLTLKPLTKREEISNYGLTDLTMALKWIHENIEHFGGDASRVTLLSHGSAAALSLILATNENSSKYISRLWLASPTPVVAKSSLVDMYDSNQAFISSVDCQPNVTDIYNISRIDEEVVECLLRTSAPDVVKATPEAWYKPYNDLPKLDELPPTPVIALDGKVVKDNPYNLLAKDSRIQIVIGANVEDTGAVSLKPNFVDGWESSDFMEKLKENLPLSDLSLKEQVMDYYVNRTNYTNNEQLYHSMVTDIRLLCPLLKSLEPAKESGKNVFVYVNEYKPSVAIRYSEKHSHTSMTVHGIDVLALLDLLTNWFVINPKDNDNKFMTVMQTQFKRFIHEGATEGNQLDLEPFGSSVVNTIAENGTLNLQVYPFSRCAQPWSTDLLKYAKLI